MMSNIGYAFLIVLLNLMTILVFWARSNPMLLGAALVVFAILCLVFMPGVFSRLKREASEHDYIGDPVFQEKVIAEVLWPRSLSLRRRRVRQILFGFSLALFFSAVARLALLAT